MGDALGAPVEFLSLGEIHRRFGTAGIVDFAPAYGKLGAITDDTQMTLFTAEGLLDTCRLGQDPAESIRAAYGRWLLTQGGDYEDNGEQEGLLAHRELWSLRAPGNTCLSALRSGRPVLQSKECGGVMRVAPVGLVYDGREAFRIGAESARITHGHPSGYLPAGAFAMMIGELVRGGSLTEAVDHANEELRSWEGHKETLRAIQGAVELAGSRVRSEPEIVERLGEAWTGHEALAIGLFCALRAGDFAHGVRLAANHSGDSDSTASLTGQLLGAQAGVETIPPGWLDLLELSDVIEQVGRDLYGCVG